MTTFAFPGPVMLDIEGTVLNANDRRRLLHPLTGAVILFSRNYTSRQQLMALTAEIHAVRPGILIAVDHEGGRVQRFKTDGFTVLPTMRSIGQLADTDLLAATRAATAAGYVLAAELRAHGVDLSFTPVLDLDYGQSEVIGSRAFHKDPRTVALLAKSLNHGLALVGMANCGKHYPGHGYAAADSHVALPVDERSLADIWASDVAPYQWLGLSLAGVMPAHVVYPQVDSLPAGFSRIWLDRLRNDLHFDGVIFSDDLSMEGARVAGDVVAGATLALNAGCDMVLICNAPEQADQLLEQLPGQLAGYDHAPSAARIARLTQQPAVTGWDALQQQAEYQTALQEIRGLAIA